MFYLDETLGLTSPPIKPRLTIINKKKKRIRWHIWDIILIIISENFYE